VRGLNTAATLWASAAVGCFAGARKPAEAVLVAGFVLAGNTLLRPLVDFVNRRPMAPGETEALYRVHVVCPANVVSAARDLLFDELETHHYPIREMETLAEGDTQVELAAILVPTTANPADLDSITAHIARHEGITSATWTVSATN